MTIKLKYAYLKDQTWMYRRNYPADVRCLLGTQALKQSLRTSDPKLAKTRAAEVNTRFEQIVTTTRAKGKASLEELIDQPLTDDPVTAWQQAVTTLRAAFDGERGALPAVAFQSTQRLNSRRKVDDLASEYIQQRAKVLRPDSFKNVRYSVGLFSSAYGNKVAALLTQTDAKRFAQHVGQLAPTVGKSYRTRNKSMEALLKFSATESSVISARTQKRIVSQVSTFLRWAVKEGQLAANPFDLVEVEQRVRPAPYAVPTDADVQRLLSARDHSLFWVTVFCLLTGMRAGEAVGLLREDLVHKGNLGVFALIRPNRLRELKTEAAERVVPLHPVLQDQLVQFPSSGPLFPGLTVPIVSKRFATLKKQLGIDRPGLVFHSTRKWFITQCERAGVPEHFTASLVGHQSSRSENRLTYSIYSAGISDEQKRGIIDSIRLPT
jgi:integrase